MLKKIFTIHIWLYFLILLVVTVKTLGNCYRGDKSCCLFTML